MKKYLAMLLALIMVLSLAACSGGTTAEDEAAQSNTAEPAKTSEDAQAQPEPEKEEEPETASGTAGTYSYEETLPFGTVPWTLELSEDSTYALSVTKPTGASFTYTGTYTVDGDVVTTGTPAEDTGDIEAGFFNADYSCPWKLLDSGKMEPVNDAGMSGFSGGFPFGGGAEGSPSEPVSVGEYTMDFTGNFGAETFTLALNDDGTCVLSSSNGMIGPWTGTYSADGSRVSVKGLYGEGMMSGAPGLWPEWIDAETGDAQVVIDGTTFTFEERETSGESGAIGFPGSLGGDDTLPEEGYTSWTNEAYGDLPGQTFNAMMKDGPGARPVLIVVPGGAFRFVDGGHYSDFTDYFCEQNYLVMQLSYTVGEGSFPQAIIDVKTAIQYVIDHADVLHADVNNITVLGCSAGGYLAAMAAFTGNDAYVADGVTYTYSVRNLVDFFGATQWMTDDLIVGANSAESGWIGKDVSAMSAEERAASDPLSYLDADDVTKVWVSHGTADTMMPIGNSESFYEGAKAVLGEENAHFEVIEGAAHEGAAFYTDENFAKVADFIA